MNGFLLDTNVLSELRRPQCFQSVATFTGAQPDTLLFTSEVNFAEIRFGRDLLADQSKQKQIDDWLAHVLRPWFAGRLLPVIENTLVGWRHIVESGRTRGYTFPEPDTLIAAVAVEHELVVVTRDVTPFVQAGVAVLDPWLSRVTHRNGTTVAGVAVDDPKLINTVT